MSDICRLIWCALIGLFRSRAALEAEILVLRRQLNVLRRKSPKRVALSSIDRLLLVGLYRVAPGVLDALKIVRPETLMRWHRAGFRAYWRWKSRPHGGRSPLSGAKSAGGGGTGSEVGATSVGQREGEVGNIYHLFEKKGGVPSDKSATDPFPTVKWVSVENGGRDAGDQLEDKAATFISTQNTLLVNADFRVFKDMIGRLCKEKDAGPGPGLQDAVREIVHQWFEQALVETVIGKLKGSKEWGPEEIEKALTPEALTSAVMQRYHVYIACKREVGARFGKFSASG